MGTSNLDMTSLIYVVMKLALVEMKQIASITHTRLNLLLLGHSSFGILDALAAAWYRRLVSFS